MESRVVQSGAEQMRAPFVIGVGWGSFCGRLPIISIVTALVRRSFPRELFEPGAARVSGRTRTGVKNR